MMTATGRAATRVMAPPPLRPPASISTMAVTPSTAAQNSRCQTGERAWPREAMLSTTKAPESAEVTKNTAISTMVSQATGLNQGRYSKKRNSSRSEEHTSELQSPCNLVCRLLLEKKKKQQ